MQPKAKIILKNEISQFIDLSNGHFTNDELLFLKSIVDRRESLVGRTHTSAPSIHKDYDRDGKYEVEETKVYSIKQDLRGVYFEIETFRKFDGVLHDNYAEQLRTGREIVNNQYRFKHLLR